MSMLNYRHLHYFWVVAKEGGFARAAERLDMAVQTVSARPKPAKAAPGAHAIDDGDDEDYGLDDDDLDADEENVALKGPKMVKKGDGR